MESRATEIIYLGFLLPALFALTLVCEGIYRVYKREDGWFNIILGSVLLIGLSMFYLLILKR